MTQALAAYDTYLSDFQALTPELDRQPEWLRDLRRRAFAHFQEVGFPTARKGNEPWKYTNVGSIAERRFASASGGPPDREPAVEDLEAVAPWCTVWHEAVFVNGRYSPGLSASAATHEPKGGLRGAVVLSLQEAIASHEDLVREHLGRYARYDHDGFTALNAAFLRDGAFVYVPDGQEIPTHIHLLFVTAGAGEPMATYPRTLIVAGRQSKVTVIETYVSLDGAPCFTDPVTEIALNEGARVDHYRLLLDAGAYHIGTSRVHQDRDSSFASLSFATGPALARNDFQVLLDAPGASCFLRGLYVTTGSQHIDNYLNIDHAQPHCTSRLYYKGILDDESRAVFGGTVLVRPGADKTDAYQEDKNLLLSDRAEVDSKPSLEIYADDVKCGHGATAGAIADEALFYMRSRGLDEQTARVFLIKGFASEVLDAVQPEPLRHWLEEKTMRVLPRFTVEAPA
ncbi:MAG: Fe-S cluster assembly protein SufD [Dehalococcoidia bacterium]|nr:Fe-S cluster assembly protein SufD [Dehalococcoidia bacterium]